MLAVILSSSAGVLCRRPAVRGCMRACMGACAWVRECVCLCGSVTLPGRVLTGS